MQGKIIKISSDTSQIIDENLKVWTAHIKGNTKKNLKPCVGDNIDFRVLDENLGTVNIIHINPRINTIYRPRITNVDQVIIVTPLFRPLFGSYILNKYIMMAQSKLITPILLFTKIDLLKKSDVFNEVLDKIKWYETLDFDIIVLNNKNANEYSYELDKLKKIMTNKVSFFTGQTGAGKSTTLNHFLQGEEILTNDISEKLNRGKHTTTDVKIYSVGNSILIADTPGFSSFDLDEISVEDVLSTFSVFNKFKNICKFSDCTHIHEIKCGVKNAVENDLLPPFIYNDYVKVVEELNKKIKRY